MGLIFESSSRSTLLVEHDPRIRGDKPFPKSGIQPRLREGMLFGITLYGATLTRRRRLRRELPDLGADRVERPELVLGRGKIVRIRPVGGVDGLLQAVGKVLFEIGP